MTGKRVSWLFPSVKEAECWKKQKYWKHLQYPDIEEYLEQVAPGRREQEKRNWHMHKDNYADLILKKGTAIYED